ncbi:MAG: HyaD/HybD family hydrogenase maturation endopeptidase [Deltaproteobacteria bacterium]|nr:HyaD/HybD family hydrogenase maturation endopeptidase [Deltaproteobacteria bacterium]
MRAAKKNKKTLVVGAGNILLRDEGAGVRALEAFLSEYSAPKAVVFLDAGAAGLAVLDRMKDYTDIIIIDAARMKKRPGAVHRISGDMISKSAIRTTAHDIGLNEALELAAFDGDCPDVTLIGIEPKDITPGLGLTPCVEKKIPKAVLKIKAELERLGFKSAKRGKNARIPLGKKYS